MGKCYNKNMENQFSRTALLLGESGVEKLNNSSVLVFGVGGVGGYLVESLVRSGVGKITIVDKDVISESNLNRQIIALHSTVGRKKVEVMKERILDINPHCEVTALAVNFGESNADEFDFSAFDYIVDCIDDVPAKLQIIHRANVAEVPVISAMGAGNKVEPRLLTVADIKETKVCPLARAVRRKMVELGLGSGLKVAYSTEQPVQKGEVIGSVAFTPSVMGLLISAEVIKDLTK